VGGAGERVSDADEVCGVRAVALLIFMALLGCSEKKALSKEEHDNTDKFLSRLRDREGIGRFQLIPAANNEEVFLLDTATGCIEVLMRFKSKNEPNISVWMRKFVDDPVAIENVNGQKSNTPPRRCEKIGRLEK
jgi:hypothetical protein